MLFLNSLQSIRRAWAVNNTRRELNALSDCQLADIGLLRAQIDQVSSGLVARQDKPSRHKVMRRGMSLMPLMQAHLPRS